MEETESMKGKYVYGGLILARYDAIKEKHGMDGLNTICKKMRDKGSDIPLIGEIKMKDKYPVVHLIHTLKTYEDLYGKDDMHRMSKSAAKKKGILGMFLRWAGTIEMMFSKAEEYWPNFYAFGGLEGDVPEPGLGILTGKEIFVDEILCDSLIHYYWGVMDNLKLKDMRVSHTKCVGKGDDVCEWTFEWTP